MTSSVQTAPAWLRARRWAMRVHRWIALLVGVQILLWIAGGVVMSAIPIEVVRGEHRLAGAPAPSYDAAALLPLADAARDARFERLAAARLGLLLGEPVWRLEASDGRRAMVDARSAVLRSPLDEATALAVARADVRMEGIEARAERIETAPVEYGGPLPAWRVEFDDIDSTTLYIDALHGRVSARRSTTWRFYDLFWRLHVMDYDDGADFNHPLIITAACVALLVALSGVVLLYSYLRQRLHTARAVRRRQALRERAP